MSFDFPSADPHIHIPHGEARGEAEPRTTHGADSASFEARSRGRPRIREGGEAATGTTLRTPEALAATGLVAWERVAELERVAARYVVAVTPAMTELIDPLD